MSIGTVMTGEIAGLRGPGLTTEQVAQVNAALGAGTAAAQAAIGAVVRVGAGGDSIVQENFQYGQGASFLTSSSVGEIVWAQALYPYFEFDNWPIATAPYFAGMNGGISGNTAGDVRARLTPMLDLAPDVQIVAVGGNSIEAGLAAPAIMNDLAAIVGSFRAIGCKVILADIRPRGHWAPGSDKFAQKTALNTLIADFCAAGNAALWPAHAAYADGAGMPKAGYLRDSTHPTQAGAIAGARALVPVLRQLIKSVLTCEPRTTNAVGNPTLTAPGGTLGGGLSGEVGAGWVASTSNATAIGSLNARGERQFALSGAGGADAFFRLGRDFGGVPVTAGSWVKAYARIRLSAWSGWRLVQFVISGSFSAFGDYLPGVQIPLENETVLYIETPPFQVPTGEASLAPNFIVRLDGSAGGAGTVTMERLFVGSIADPRPLHGVAVQ